MTNFYEITTVEVRGSREPGETTFKLAVVGSNAGGADVSDVTVSGSVTTNGKGDHAGTLTLMTQNPAAYAMSGDAAELGYTVLIYPTTCEEDDDGVMGAGVYSKRRRSSR